MLSPKQSRRMRRKALKRANEAHRRSIRGIGLKLSVNELMRLVYPAELKLFTHTGRSLGKWRMVDALFRSHPLLGMVPSGR